MEDQAKSAQLPLASAAMVELKAELSRKKEEFRKEKASNNNLLTGRKFQKISLKKKADVWDRKNSGVSARAQKDIEQFEPDEDEDALLKSKLILERKCKIYDAMSSSGDIPDEDGSEGYLVDFQKKAVDTIVEQREKNRRELQEQEDEEAERRALAEPILEAENSDEEWVDYTDSLGRSRRCMRKDLKNLQKKDQDLTASVNQRKLKEKESLDGKNTNETETLHLISDDMYREKMRQKWEDEARQLVEKGQEEIHYSNVQFDEIRTHGVGFYQFSKDQEEREVQMDKLKKLRDETKTERSRTDMIKDKRKALMEARLAKVKERRKLKTKETPSGAEENADTVSELSQVEKEEKKKVEEIRRAKEEAEKVAEEARKKFIREWDKKKVASSWKGDGYIESLRQEREAEFAPPSIYFSEANPSPKNSSYRSNFRNEKFAHHQSKTFLQSNVNKNSTNIFDDGKCSFESSSDLKVSKSSVAKSATQPSEVSTNSSSSVSSVDILPIHSIPLPSDVKSTSEGSGLGRSSNMPCSHLNNNEAVQQPVDYNYSNCQSQYCESSVLNIHDQRLSSNQGTTEYSSTNTMHQQASWPQQVSWSHQQQQASWPQQHQQWPQHQYLPHQSTQSQVSEPVAHHYCNQSKTSAFANSNQVSTDIYHRLSDDNTGVKRLSAFENETDASTVNAPKKLKVPKSAILDNRFVLNSEASQPSEISASSTESGGLITVQAVPYKPGSFTEAKFKHDVPSSEEESAPSSRGKTQISGGPLLYTKEERQQQLLQMKENEGSDNDEVNEKVEEFLKSVRNEEA